MQRLMLLVFHAPDGHFADGDREGVRRVLRSAEVIAATHPVGDERYVISCTDGGEVELNAPGLEGRRAFHRMELVVASYRWTADVITVMYELMRAGGFGLMDSLEAPQFIVSVPEQVRYFPRLPNVPLLVRNPRDLAYTIGYPAA